MKHNLLRTALLTGLTTLSSLMGQGISTQAQPGPNKPGFWCDTSTGIPTTMYQNYQGGQEPWIRWTSDYFSSSGYDPLKRCQLVSDRLEMYRLQGRLKYITVGRMNSQNVICTASEMDGPCEGLIYTLRSNQNPIETLKQFLAWGVEIGNLPSGYESWGFIYIDVRSKLGKS
jgi:serine protease Do